MPPLAVQHAAESADVSPLAVELNLCLYLLHSMPPLAVEPNLCLHLLHSVPPLAVEPNLCLHLLHSVLQSLLTCLHCDQTETAVRMFVQELRKREPHLQQHRLPLYRDLLLLATEGFNTTTTTVNMGQLGERVSAY